MIDNFFLAERMTMIARRLSYPLRIVIVLVLLASTDVMGQNCNCPPAASCSPCSGGFTSFKLKYTGPGNPYIRIKDGGGTIYEGYASVDMPPFGGSLPNEKFQGSNIYVYLVDAISFIDILNAAFGTNCGDEYPGNSSGFFEIVSIVSKNGGTVCCAPGTTDNTAPSIVGCPTNKTATLPATSCTVPVSWTQPTANDNCAVSWTKSHLPNDQFPAGVTTVSYTAKDTYGNQSTCSFTVTVNDVTPPVFAGCPANITRTADASCKAKGNWIPPTATDNNSCIPNINFSHSPDDMFPVGPPTLVTYTATDAKGNKATCSFTVTVEDKTPPVFSNYPSVVSVTAESSCPKVSLPIATLTDNCSGNLNYTSSHPDGSEFSIGETTVTYTATDGAANKATCSFVVVVSNAMDPTIEGTPGTVTVNAAPKSDSTTVKWDEPWATAICGDVGKEQSHIPGSKFPIGTTPVTYTFTDGTGKSSICEFDVRVLPPDELFAISKVVTPDGDGINDVWELTNIENFKSNTVVVIDRWGNKIFEATGYNNEGTVWRGTNSSGTIVATGTYFYTIEVRDQGKVVLKKGFIEVIQ